MTDGAPAPTSAEVDAVLARLPEAQRTALQAIRDAAHRAVPEATEVISNGLPTLIHFGPLLSFGPHASNRALCSLYALQPKLLASMRSAIAPHTVSGGTIHFAPDDPLPDALVERIARERARENAAAHIRAQQRRK